MAAPGHKYFMQSSLTPQPHHKSFKILWETVFKESAIAGIYPFMFGKVEDFEPIVQAAEQKNLSEPYNWDEYASIFIPKAEELVNKAKEAEKKGGKEEAADFYLRASAVYRISRYPVPRSNLQREAWTKGKDACLRGLRLQSSTSGIQEVQIPHTHALPQEGKIIPAYFQLPASASERSPVPLIVIICGLDAYRTELAFYLPGITGSGAAALILEIPGTGDSPADPSDPTSGDRQWSSMFEWIRKQKEIDDKKIVCWGISTGAAHAVRLAHTHKDCMLGLAAHGGGCHYMFDAEWLEASQYGEYPFDLGSSLAYKFGYGDDFERFKKEARSKYSLLEQGIIDKPCCKNFLVVNGTDDTIFPIDDYYLLLQHGDPKHARFVEGAAHMGRPTGYPIVVKWILDLLEVERFTVEDFMRTVVPAHK